jgi:hypothetical protein
MVYMWQMKKVGSSIVLIECYMFMRFEGKWEGAAL